MDDTGVWTPNSRSADSSILAEFCEVIWGMERNILTALDQNPETRGMSFRISIKQLSVGLRKLVMPGIPLVEGWADGHKRRPQPYPGANCCCALLLAMMPAQAYGIGIICTCRQVSDWSA